MQQVVSRKEAKEKGLKRHFTGKPCKHGHISERLVSNGKCCSCNAEHQKKYYEQNKERIAEYQRKWDEKNKEKADERKRKYREQNKEKVSASYRKWQKANPEKVFIRSSLQRIQGNWKGGRTKTEEILGYTYEQLREHIESQFKDGMSWDNRSEWHVDHKKPISAFLKEGITDPAIINSLDNLQPLWAHENLSKHAKWDEKTKQQETNEME